MDSRQLRHRLAHTCGGPVLIVALSLAGCGGGSTAVAPTTPPSSATSQPSGPGVAPPSNPVSSVPTPAPATEVNPPGDIPDSQVFVDYTPPGSRFRVKVPEGWSRSSVGTVVTFSDKLNSVSIQLVPASAPPTVATATSTEVPALARLLSKFTVGEVSDSRRKGGPCIRITYQQDSAADQVTGKVVRDAVERYEFYRAGTEAILTLSGPVTADNVDPWRIVSDSAGWA